MSGGTVKTFRIFNGRSPCIWCSTHVSVLFIMGNTCAFTAEQMSAMMQLFFSYLRWSCIEKIVRENLDLSSWATRYVEYYAKTRTSTEHRHPLVLYRHITDTPWINCQHYLQPYRHILYRRVCIHHWHSLDKLPTLPSTLLTHPLQAGLHTQHTKGEFIGKGIVAET